MGMAGIFQAKKAGYPLNMEGFWILDKFRSIAAIDSSDPTGPTNPLVKMNAGVYSCALWRLQSIML